MPGPPHSPEGPFNPQEPRESCTVLALSETPLRTRNIEIIVEKTDEIFLPRSIAMDIDQIIFNIVLNARDAIVLRRRHRSALPGKIVISARNVTFPKPLAPSGRTNAVLIEISDNGGGIPDEIIDRVFDPLFSTKTGRNRSGLGLSLSHTMARRFGGWIVTDASAPSFFGCG
jgi:two-component system cell cycle sensor histidine kinase/response regulator CckA